MKGSRKWAAAALVLVLFVLGRCALESRREFMKGEGLAGKGETAEAILHFDRSIHWYFPLNPYVERSIRSLWDLGRALETKDRDMALRAYESIRGGLYAVRSFFQPHEDWIPKANERIAALRATSDTETNRLKGPEEALKYHRGLLEADERPRTGWVLLTEIGFFGWLGCTVLLIARGYNREGRMNLARALPWMSGMVLFFLAWILGLLKA
jgi:hypothetical protein